ncbi:MULTISPECIES: Chromate resistance protein ChrB [unclassified Leifsonia]|uniref:Chromate resistance protein ChrB n=1 Tax=unclassified Leifsonia TaxID=2663824 RepID=UPI0007009957|nr:MULTISPECIES: Chromate resistance protein ChrB [unclassified Leifsonia]KQX07658.1 chromate resistance protein ChrB [Leifsonia sp. Root1293]KRA11940.1 chromate resistance protein ChrB [Leifsonia sp. Root60]
MTIDTEFAWLLVIPRVPSEPSRHRVAVWRELRRLGAVPAASGAWAIPDLPAFTEPLPDLRSLAERGGGSLTVLRVESHGDDDVASLADAFIATRTDEWHEFIADCGKFEGEIDREIAKEKFTFGELEEEEQSLERLRRWHRDLLRRNPIDLEIGRDATRRLDDVTERLSGYSELVFAANLPTAAES